ncbi:hypothetical protein [Fusobacterium sp. PH5-44]|uniref:hypothetical protein n=1 Tax=unclassified Fusobacterium TaxID=2648384 RepID=UPI003D1DF319
MEKVIIERKKEKNQDVFSVRNVIIFIFILFLSFILIWINPILIFTIGAVIVILILISALVGQTPDKSFGQHIENLILTKDMFEYQNKTIPWKEIIWIKSFENEIVIRLIENSKYDPLDEFITVETSEFDIEHEKFMKLVEEFYMKNRKIFLNKDLCKKWDYEMRTYVFEEEMVNLYDE